LAWAQFNSQILSVEPPPKVVVKAGTAISVKISAKLANGYHTNSNTPSDEYMIPLKLTWDAAPIVVAGVDYPPGRLEKYEFAEKPLSVYTGTFEITTRFSVPASTPKGLRTVPGKLRYQACTKTTCYPPKTVAVALPVEVQ
jgi:hypothetical protein